MQVESDPVDNQCLCGQCVDDEACLAGPQCGTSCGGGCQFDGGEKTPGNLIFQICPEVPSGRLEVVFKNPQTCPNKIIDPDPDTGGFQLFSVGMCKNLEPEIDLFILDDNDQQTGEAFYVHTSCSQQLFLGARFASVPSGYNAILVGYELKNTAITNSIEPWDCGNYLEDTCPVTHTRTGGGRRLAQPWTV